MQLTQFDYLLEPNGPVALVIREYLQPVAGKNSPIFPPTFAAPEGSQEKPDYVIDKTAEGKSIALVDSVGSQANRLEPIFKRPPFDALVPQIIVKIGERSVNLLDAGHRLADAVVRLSSAAPKINEAFITYERTRNAAHLARLNPTAIVFGVWDSRGTQVKLPRLVSSLIRATDVDKLTRSAQYFALLEKEEALQIDSDQKYLSNQGFSDAPSGRGPGGILVRGEILREAVLNLIPLRALAADTSDNTVKLQRYILGLSLIAFLAPAEYYLRQGCLLTADPERPSEPQAVNRKGQREPFSFDETIALDYARLAAAEFGVGESFTAEFTIESAKQAKKEADEKKKKEKK
jgi:CRISPR-associated protein Csb1